MKYTELMVKISAHELQKQVKKHKHEVTNKPVHLVEEETPHELEIKQEEKEEEQITEHEEAVAEEQPKPKKSSGKKPANRAYMVVENIEEQN